MRIATLCGMGFGTSMMLKLFIDDILKAEEIKADVIPWDLGSFKGQQADIVVAPTDMASHLKSYEGVVVFIRNLIDKKEVRDKVLGGIEEFKNRS
ncbi:MAG: PTS sugar transporter subunit IIB [Anaerolineales bacterium]|nr:PTS sugar transporter subunit IIB [Anaerolineales bacterium]